MVFGGVSTSLQGVEWLSTEMRSTDALDADGSKTTPAVVASHREAEKSGREDREERGKRRDTTSQSDRG